MLLNFIQKNNKLNEMSVIEQHNLFVYIHEIDKKREQFYHEETMVHTSIILESNPEGIRGRAKKKVRVEEEAEAILKEPEEAA